MSKIQKPVIGDGFVTVPVSVPTEEIDIMAGEPIDLPPSVASQLLTETTGNIQSNNRDGRALSTAALGSLQAGIAKTHNELGPAESRAVSGVLATPVAAPTTSG